MSAFIRIIKTASADLPTVPTGKQIIFLDDSDNMLKVKKDDQMIYPLGAGSGVVSSVNGMVGAVVIDPDDLDDSATTHKFIDAAGLTKIGYITVSASVDLDALKAHLTNTSNPHSTTKSQVGLGSVDNTADADKPISTAVAAALLTKMTAKGNWDNGTQYFPSDLVIDNGQFYYCIAEHHSAEPPNPTFWMPLFTLTFPILADSGTPESPSYGFKDDDDQDSGMYEIEDGHIGWSTNGVLKMDLDPNGNLNLVGNITAANFPISGQANRFTQFDADGHITSLNEFGYNPDLFNSINWNHNVIPAVDDSFQTLHYIYGSYNPEANSKKPWNHMAMEVGIGTDDSGFSVGDYTDVKSTLVEGDITFTANRRGVDGDIVTIEFIGGGTAGTEVLTNPTQFEYVLQIEDGVSTATQIVAAINDQVGNLGNNLKAEVSGTGSNPQSVFAQTNLAGGIFDSGGINMFELSFYSRNKSNVGFLNGYSMDIDFGNNTDIVRGNRARAFGGNLNVHDNSSFQNVSAFEYGFGVSTNGGQIRGDARGVNIYGELNEVTGGILGVQVGWNAETADYVNMMQVNMHVRGDVAHSVNNFADFSNYDGDIGDNYYGVTIQPNINTTDGFYGVNISPNVSSSRFQSVGVNVNMGGVIVAPGTPSSVVVQDITYTGYEIGTGLNGLTIQYVSDVTAGSESAELVGNTIIVHMEDGVSTADQIRTALEAQIPIVANINVVITGTGSNPQTIDSQVFSGGTQGGSKYAAQFNGAPVQINGQLQVQANVDTAVDQLQFVYGVNNIGGQFKVSSGSPIDGGQFGVLNNFGIGLDIQDDVGPDGTGLGLGLNMTGILTQMAVASGKTADSISFLNMAASVPSGSGAITNLSMLRVMGIVPQGGSLDITNMYGLKIESLLDSMSADNTWGVYVDSTGENFFRSSLNIGSATKKVSNSSVGIEIGSKKALLFARMTTAERDTLVAIGGMMIFNTDTSAFEGFDGTSWLAV